MGYAPFENPMSQSNRRSSANLGEAIRGLVNAKLAEATREIQEQTARLRTTGIPPSAEMFGMEGPPGTGGEITLIQETMRRENAFYQRIMPSAPPPPKGKKQTLREEMLKYAKPWSQMDTKMQNPLVLQASTFNPQQLFPNCPRAYFGTNTQDACVLSPSGTFAYANRVLPKAYPLKLRQGSKKGEVWFDGEVVIPTLYKADRPMDVWMSLAPQELLTLRPGLRKAKGKVVVGGLGLGWLLSEICHKDIVGDVILVEKNKELMEWYGHALCKRLPKVADVIIGDVYDHLGKYGKQTRYILDLWKGYGAARGDARLQDAKKWVHNIWAWGDVQF